MLFIGDNSQDDDPTDACLYDDFSLTGRNSDGCIGRQGIDRIDEGVAIVHLPFETRNFRYLKLVIQPRQDHDSGRFCPK